VTYSWYREIPLTDTTLTYELVANSQSFEVYDLPTGTHRYYLVLERNGCSVSSLPDNTQSNATGIFTEVVVRSVPEVSLPEVSGTYCEGDSLRLDAPSIEGGEYAWTGPNDFVSFEEDPLILESSSASGGVYRLVVSNGSCVAPEVSTQILVSTQPRTPTISYDGSTCEGDELRLTVSNIANGNNVRYEWTGPNDFFATTQNLVLPNAQTAFSGEYAVRVIVNGCPSLASLPTPVVIHPIPAAPSVATNGPTDAPLCEGETILLETDFSVNTSYNWTGPEGFNSNVYNPTITDAQLSNSGTYALNIIENDCTSPISFIEVAVQGKPSLPFAANSGPICAGNDLTLSVANPIPGNSYEWFKQEGNVFIGAGAVLVIPDVDIRDAGAYYVLASVGDCISDAFGDTGVLEAVYTEVIIENPVKELALTEGYVFACENSATISANPPQSANGFWSTVDANSPVGLVDPTNPNTQVVNLQTGQNAFVWSLETSTCGVISTDTLIVEYNIAPVVNSDFYVLDLNETRDLNLIENDELPTTDVFVNILTDLQLGRVVRTGQGIFTYIPNENAVGVETFTYQICHKECTDQCAETTVTVSIGESSECFAGELVTPNNDGFNDTFIVPCLANYEGSALSIYNRYGDEIYFNANYQNDWDGTYEGLPLPAGTYYYILRVNDPQGTVLSGYIFLQR